jgi:hypothetical protein
MMFTFKAIKYFAVCFSQYWAYFPVSKLEISLPFKKGRGK